MRKLELHVYDMQFLINEMSDRATFYKMTADSYNRVSRKVDSEQVESLREIARDCRKRQKKAERIVRRMQEQQVHWSWK